MSCFQKFASNKLDAYLLFSHKELFDLSICAQQGNTQREMVNRESHRKLMMRVVGGVLRQ